MNNFPYYNHFEVKLSFPMQVELDESLVDRLSSELVDSLALSVVKTENHVFDNGGLTKVFILSESHLVVHTWPEKQAVHLNLMTCRQGLTKEQIEKAVQECGAIEAEVVKLM